jgi:HK97 family phage major capsid protein
MSSQISTAELDRAFDALEKKVSSVVQDRTLELSDRVKELEQKSFGGGSEPSSFAFSTKAGSDRLFNEMRESDSVKQFLGGQTKNAKAKIDSAIFVKNTILGESGSPQSPDRVIVEPQRMGVVGGAFRSLNLLDFIQKDATTSNLIEYPRESAFSNQSAETLENGTKPESSLTFELVEEPVRTIAHWIKMSKQVFDDSPWLQRYVTDRMLHGIQTKLQSQIINGDGTGANLSGITASGNATAFTPETGETALDSLNRAKYAVLTADYEPDFVMMRPADWGAIERLKRGTSDEGYILGDGQGMTFVNGGLQGTVWGLPVIVTNEVPAGKFILGDSNAMRLIVRQDATAELFDQDGTDSQHNRLMLRCELRAALAILQPAALQYGDLTV